ncbi:ferritin-like domain-containing protein [Curvivirga sp.]|uniref:ferritin-like domain-containing protein n=1 Tax=Curvivirga sp. TaxID=2856848 RepID=UPI003B5A3F10
MTITVSSLTEAAYIALMTADAVEKANSTRLLAAKWSSGDITDIGNTSLPDRPARPEKPDLKDPNDVPRRKLTTGTTGRSALLHAIAHIELNAIDLAWDVVARFPHENMPKGFYDDWVKVADDEARHFLMINDRLKELGSFYGAMAAHDGLWQASQKTAHDLKARLAIVPLVLEARGLDVTPPMLIKLRTVRDDKSADCLQIIHDDEITHVAAGKRWFDYLCERDNLEKISTWQNLVRQHYHGFLKRPFNTESRDKAKFAAAFYEPLAD